MLLDSVRAGSEQCFGKPTMQLLPFLQHLLADVYQSLKSLCSLQDERADFTSQGESFPIGRSFSKVIIQASQSKTETPQSTWEPSRETGCAVRGTARRAAAEQPCSSQSLCSSDPHAHITESQGKQHGCCLNPCQACLHVYSTLCGRSQGST